MKKFAFLSALVLMFSGCTGGASIDELISARELPEYGSAINIEINEDDSAGSSGEVIVIED